MMLFIYVLTGLGNASYLSVSQLQNVVNDGKESWSTCLVGVSTDSVFATMVEVSLSGSGQVLQIQRLNAASAPTTPDWWDCWLSTTHSLTWPKHREASANFTFDIVFQSGHIESPTGVNLQPHRPKILFSGAFPPMEYGVEEPDEKPSFMTPKYKD